MLTLLVSTHLGAQAPQLINYQAIARDAAGNELSGTSLLVNVRISTDMSNTNVVYSETHNVTTNSFGLMNLQIGGGAVVSGAMTAISWGTSAHYLNIRVDQTLTGSSYVDMGTTQLVSVPYALYAKTAEVALNGPTGPTGPTGNNGLVGPTGPTGSGLACWDTDGDGTQDANEDVNGDNQWNNLDCQGNVGPAGPTGNAGPTGSVGATGPTGTGLACWDTNGNGAQDPAEDINGDTQWNNLDCQGATGPAGPTGAAGTNGATGPTGPAGPTGATGANGITGANGLACWDTNGNGINDPAEDVNGDTQWNAVDCQGAMGPVGPAGPTGAAGTNGTNGATGVTGPTGAAGTNGTNGATGATGPAGPTGAAGTNGTNGATGATGPTGPTGAAGTNGTNGATGATGPTGPTGAAGTNGTNGATGPTGAAGSNGTNGATGATGPTGPTGAAGTNGSNGATGPTGAAGTNGSNGATGATGPTGATGATGTFANGTAAGETPYWDGSQWVINRNIYNNGGFVGVGGITAPLTDLHVGKSTAANTRMMFSNQTTGSSTLLDGFLVGISGSPGDAYVLQNEAQPLWFGTQGSERMRIDANGLLGVNVIPQNARMEVAGAVNNTLGIFGTSSRGIALLQNDARIGFNMYEGAVGNTYSIGAGRGASIGLNTTNDALVFSMSNGITGAPNTILTMVNRMALDATGALGIGTLTPNAAAILDLSSTTRGFLLPRMTTAQRSSMPSVTTGLIVFDTSLGRLMYYDGTQWVLFGKGDGWSTSGNALTNPATNYIGTTDAVDLSVRTAGIDRLRIDATGRIGIGITTPGYPLHVTGTTAASGALGYFDLTTTTNVGYGAAVYANTAGASTTNLYGLYGYVSNSLTGQSTAVHGLSSVTSAATAVGVQGNGQGSTSNNYGVRGYAVGASAGTNTAIYGNSSNGATNWAGYFDGGNVYVDNLLGIGDPNPAYPLDVTTSTLARTAYIENTFNGTGTIIGTYALANGTGAGNKRGGSFEAYNGSGENVGVRGLAQLSTTDNYGVYGLGISTTGNNYGVYGTASGSTTGFNYAGYFSVSSGSASNYGIYAANTSNTGNSYTAWLDNSSTSTGPKYGIRNEVDNQGTGARYGIYNNTAQNPSSTSPFNGIYNLAYPGGTGTKYGIYSEMNNTNSPSATSVMYGISLYTNGSASHTANIYGIYSLIGPSGTSGNHYAVYGSPGSGGTNQYSFYGTADAFLSSGAWTTSDEGLKKDVQTFSGALSMLDKIDARTYYYRQDLNTNLVFPKTRQYGLLAQELELVFPEMVKEIDHVEYDEKGQETGSRKIKAVKYDMMIPVLLQAIKEQQKQIEDLQKKVEELEQK